MPENKDVAIRKRQQIDSSKKTMFLFVAGAAFVSGVAIVVSFFLVRQILFHGAVVLAKQDTINTLENNKRFLMRCRLVRMPMRSARPFRRSSSMALPVCH